ncbi:Uncharacterized protein TCAP_03397 [Tolypocladium capitatum]|uniref:Uncharacterized protein n=1 Tax=Tolypocladium capitatum TaxID=45235 RepID=A0A2K3QGJ7_9HYPO|nr:Uncharacterized protein TCAP_03397 [Tolypocladium capitatum]
MSALDRLAYDTPNAAGEARPSSTTRSPDHASWAAAPEINGNGASSVRQAAVAGGGGLGCRRVACRCCWRHCQEGSRARRPVAISRAKVLHVDAHYDARFMAEPLEEALHREVIRVLIQTYLATCRELGVQTWLMHGSLLGWWWGKKASSEHSHPSVGCP